MSKTVVGKARTVKTGGGFAASLSIPAGGVAVIVVAVIAMTHQHTVGEVFHGVVYGLAMVGGGLVLFGVWWVRRRLQAPPVPAAPVCACHAHQVPAGHDPVPVPPAARPPAISGGEPRVTNYFFGDATAAEAIAALGGRRDPQE
jgi:hypothetical protein